jgi:hypothetical protein
MADEKTKPREIKPEKPVTLEEMAAIPKGIMIGGEQYNLPPLTARRTAEFAGWFRPKMKREHMRAVIDLNLRGADKVDALNAYKIPDTLEVFGGMTQPDGLVHVIWLSLRDEYPQLTEREIGEALTLPQATKAAEDLLGIEEQRKEIEGQDGDSAKNPGAAT